MVGAERLHERRVEQQRVEVHDHEGDERARGQQRDAHARRHAVERRLAGALARYRDVEAAAHPVALQDEHEERREQQHERQHRAAAQVEEPGDLQVRLRGQHRELVAGEDQRRGEVGERRREQEQERVGEPGHGERHRHRAEHAPARRAERERHALHVGVDGGEQRPQREVRDREVGEDLREQRAREAVHRDALESQQLVGDEPARPEREDHRDRGRERRRHQRQQHRGVDGGQQPARQPRARRGEREQEAERSCRRCPPAARAAGCSRTRGSGACRSGPWRGRRP